MRFRQCIPLILFVLSSVLSQFWKTGGDLEAVLSRYHPPTKVYRWLNLNFASFLQWDISSMWCPQFWELKMRFSKMHPTDFMRVMTCFDVFWKNGGSPEGVASQYHLPSRMYQWLNINFAWFFTRNIGCMWCSQFWKLYFRVSGMDPTDSMCVIKCSETFVKDGGGTEGGVSQYHLP